MCCCVVKCFRGVYGMIEFCGIKVEPEQAIIRRYLDHVNMRLPLVLGQQLTATEDQTNKERLPLVEDLSDLCCRNCSFSLWRAQDHPPIKKVNILLFLVASSTFSSVLLLFLTFWYVMNEWQLRWRQVFSLPSTYWLELADFWTCGNCCAFRQFPTGLDSSPSSQSVCVDDKICKVKEMTHALMLSHERGLKPTLLLLSALSVWEREIYHVFIFLIS